MNTQSAGWRTVLALGCAQALAAPVDVSSGDASLRTQPPSTNTTTPSVAAL